MLKKIIAAQVFVSFVVALPSKAFLDFGRRYNNYGDSIYNTDITNIQHTNYYIDTTPIVDSIKQLGDKVEKSSTEFVLDPASIKQIKETYFYKKPASGDATLEDNGLGSIIGIYPDYADAGEFVRDYGKAKFKKLIEHRIAGAVVQNAVAIRISQTLGLKDDFSQLFQPSALSSIMEQQREKRKTLQTLSGTTNKDNPLKKEDLRAATLNEELKNKLGLNQEAVNAALLYAQRHAMQSNMNMDEYKFHPEQSQLQRSAEKAAAGFDKSFSEFLNQSGAIDKDLKEELKSCEKSITPSEQERLNDLKASAKTTKDALEAHNHLEVGVRSQWNLAIQESEAAIKLRLEELNKRGFDGTLDNESSRFTKIKISTAGVQKLFTIRFEGEANYMSQLEDSLKKELEYNKANSRNKQNAAWAISNQNALDTVQKHFDADRYDYGYKIVGGKIPESEGFPENTNELKYDVALEVLSKLRNQVKAYNFSYNKASHELIQEVANLLALRNYANLDGGGDYSNIFQNQESTLALLTQRHQSAKDAVDIFERAYSRVTQIDGEKCAHAKLIQQGRDDLLRVKDHYSKSSKALVVEDPASPSGVKEPSQKKHN